MHLELALSAVVACAFMSQHRYGAIDITCDAEKKDNHIDWDCVFVSGNVLPCYRKS